MISRIKYDTLPGVSLAGIKRNPLIYIIILIAAILTIVTNGEGSFSFCLFYIFSGIIRSTRNTIFRQHNKEVTEEVSDELELKNVRR